MRCQRSEGADVEPHPYENKPWELFSSPAAHGEWAPVAGLTGDPQATFAVSGRGAWFDNGWRSTTSAASPATRPRWSCTG
jgi:hypothetical protein